MTERWRIRWGKSDPHCDYLRDVGYFHVLDYYLHRACHELAPLSRHDHWHSHPSRYRDVDNIEDTL